MKNVVIINSFILLLSLLSCKQTTKNITNNAKPINFYEKVDSIKLIQKKVYIEKFYSKKNIEYVINISNDEKHPIPFFAGESQPNGFTIDKKNDNSFVISFMMGNATFYDYFFYLDMDNGLNFSKINFEYDYKNQNKIIKDSIIINKKMYKVDKLDFQKIKVFINNH